MYKLLFQFVILILLFSGCKVGIETSILKKFPPLDSLQHVRVYDVNEQEPQGATIVGTVRIFDQMSANCDSAVVYSAAKEEARKSGSNILKVTKHTTPSIWGSTCHQINGIMLKDSVHQDSLNGNETIYPKTFIPGSKPVNIHDSRIALSVGWGWQIAKLADGLTDFERAYLNELKTGLQCGLEYNYFIKKSFAIGLVSSYFYSRHSAYASIQSSSGAIVNGTLSDEIHILYVGPNVTWRKLSKTGANAFLAGASIGFMGYRDNISFVNSGVLTGQTVGLSYDIGYDYGISKHTSIGIGLFMRFGALHSIKVRDHNGQTEKIHLEDGQAFEISHVGLTLGLRFK